MSQESKYTVDKPYSATEEALNIWTHGLGFLLAIVATALLVVKAGLTKDPWQIVSVSIYGVSMMLLYMASTLYHSAKNPARRRKLNVFDHASIYVLIAGTYTPFLLVTLRGPWGWSLFGVIWGAAIAGIIFKLFYTGRFTLASTIAYVVMGMLVLVAIKPLMDNLSPDGLLWLLAGGIFYIIGAVLYMLRKMPYHHATFHVFVLLGSFSHFWAIYKYVLQ